MANAKTFLEKRSVFSWLLLLLLLSSSDRYNDELELEDAIHTAILTLKEGFEGQMTEHNIEIGVADASGFRRLQVTFFFL